MPWTHRVSIVLCFIKIRHATKIYYYIIMLPDLVCCRYTSVNQGETAQRFLGIANVNLYKIQSMTLLPKIGE